MRVSRTETRKWAVSGIVLSGNYAAVTNTNGSKNGRSRPHRALPQQRTSHEYTRWITHRHSHYVKEVLEPELFGALHVHMPKK
jgi:hypothetical protein